MSYNLKNKTNLWTIKKIWLDEHILYGNYFIFILIKKKSSNWNGLKNAYR